MEHNDVQTFAQIWLIAAASLLLCHQVSARIPAGVPRLLSLLPVIYLFSALPLRLSSVHLIAPAAFYLVWLGNFKLLLFSFDRGPLSAHPPLPLLHFLTVGLLPIEITKKPSPSNRTPISIFLLKFGLLAAVVGLRCFGDVTHPYLILALCCCHLYLGLELMLAVTAEPARAGLGVEIRPQFDEPYLATSLQDFWGRRWNLVASGILRPSVYDPARRAVGGSWDRPAATMATFLVSGLMHEVMFYYLTRAAPTWEVTWFFVLQGACVVAEAAAKKRLGGWGVGRAASRAATVGFVAVTGGWLFFPQVIRNGVVEKALDEYLVLGRFIRDRLLIVF